MEGGTLHIQAPPAQPPPLTAPSPPIQLPQTAAPSHLPPGSFTQTVGPSSGAFTHPSTHLPQPESFTQPPQLPTGPKGTFITALLGDPNAPKPHSNRSTSLNISHLPRPSKTISDGEITLHFPEILVDEYAKPFRFALVGKFYNGKPPLEKIRAFFSSLHLTGECSVGLLDYRHIILNFSHESDFLRIYSRSLWYIAGMVMRIFKWTVHFHVDRESSTTPIWFRLPKIPLHWQNDDALFTIGNTFGQTLRIDSATEKAKRPNLARIQVEIDLLKPLPSGLNLQRGSDAAFWQKIVPDEQIPPYCGYCWRMGHAESDCMVKHPDLLNSGAKNIERPALAKATKQVYVPLNKSMQVDGQQTVDTQAGPSGEKSMTQPENQVENEPADDRNQLPQSNDPPNPQTNTPHTLLLPPTTPLLLSNSFIDLQETEMGTDKDSPSPTTNAAALPQPQQQDKSLDEEIECSRE